MLAKPHKPPHRVPASSIAALLPWGTVRTFLLPHAPFPIANVPQEQGPPQWQLWFEPWYHMICPTAWKLLEEDESLDEATLLVFGEYRRVRQDSGADEEELDQLLREESDIRKERVNRWTYLFALHGVRQKFLAHHRRNNPNRSEDAIMREEAQQAVQEVRSPSASPHSVWPLGIPHPPFSPRQCHCPAALTSARPIWLVRTPPFILPTVSSAAADQEYLLYTGRRYSDPPRTVDEVVRELLQQQDKKDEESAERRGRGQMGRKLSPTWVF